MQMPKMLLKSWTFVQVLALLMAVAAFIVAKAEHAHGADRDLGQRYSTVANGDISIVGNTSMTCPSSSACTAARNGTATGNAASNNAYVMTYVDVDADATTFSSSRADLALPAGATVLFAGLYWGGESTSPDSVRGAVKLDTPAAGGYINLSATSLDSATSDASQYQGFVNVTSLVGAGGNGTYTAANVNGTSTSANKYAAWSLVVAYSLPSATRNHLKVYDGLQRVSTENPTESVAISGITTPATGSIPASLGIIAYDGDRGIIGGSATLNTTPISDAQNPANNVFNSSITRGGSHFTAKDPNYVNQLGYDADIFSTSGALAAGSTSATLTLTTAGGDYYLPGVVTLVNPPETVAPNTTIDSGPSGLTNDSTPTWAFSSSEAGSTFECRIDGGAWNTCASPFTPAALADGAHTFDVRAIDPQLNVDASPATRSITVDATAPALVTLTDSDPDSPANDNSPEIKGGAEAGSTVRLYTNSTCTSAIAASGTAGAFASPGLTVTVPGDATTTFWATATDAAGNTSVCSTSSLAYREDSTAPDSTITTGPSGVTGDSTPTWAFTSSETPSTFQCRIDGGAWSACASPFTPAALTDGAHSFDVRAIDAAGNSDATPASRSITVDTAAPNTTIDSGPSGVTGDSTPTWAFSSSEAGSTFECRLDGGTWNACASPFTPAALTDGAHSFEVRATDPSGNVDASPASRSVTVDTAAPDTSIDSGPSGLTGDDTPAWAFSSTEPGSSFECRIDAGLWVSCASPLHAHAARRRRRTHSTCARSTSRATPTRARPRAPSRSTPQLRRPRSTPVPRA